MHRTMFFAAIMALAAPAAAATMQQPAEPPTDQTEAPPAAETEAPPAGGDFASFDTDQNGSLNQAEFSAWASAQGASAEAASAVFTQADSDGNGEISASELATVTSKPQ